MRKLIGIILLASCGTTSQINSDQPIKSDSFDNATTITASEVLYGFNGLMTYANFSYTDEQCYNTILKFPFRIFRWPGGGIVDEWNWHTGLPDDGSGNPCTVQDIKFLFAKTNMKVSVVLNMFKTNDDNLKLVDSLKSLGLDFNLEMHNEANNVNAEIKKKYPTAQSYAQACQTLIGLIKSKYPDIKCGIAGGNKNYKPDGVNWNNIMLKWCNNFDAFILHSYTKPDYYADRFGNVDSTKLAKTCQAEISSSGLKGINKPVWLTEYNWQVNDKQGDNYLTDAGQQYVTYYMSKTYPKLLPQISVMCVQGITGKQGIMDVYRDTTTKPTSFKAVILNTGIAMAKFFEVQ